MEDQMTFLEGLVNLIVMTSVYAGCWYIVYRLKLADDKSRPRKRA